MRRLFAPVAGLLVLLLTGCFDFTEEVWVYKDQSARIAWTYGFNERDLGPDQIEEFKRSFEEAAQDLATREGVTKAESRYELRDGLHQYTLDASLASYKTLESLGESSARKSAGKYGLIYNSIRSASSYRFEELENGRMRWTRSFANDGEQFAKMAFEARKLALLRGQEPRQHKITFRFHAPRIDAAESATSPGKRTVEWSYAPDDDSVPAELTADFRFAPAMPWTLMLGGAAAVAGFVWLRRKWAKRWE